MSTSNNAYETLRKSMREISLLSSAGSVLHWDEQTNMPRAGTEFRADQVSLIARTVHEQFTSAKIGEQLSAAEQSNGKSDPDSDESANLREWRRDYTRATKLPSSLVEELSKTEVLSQSAWAQARKQSDFNSFKPWLKKMMDLKKQVAKCYGYKQHIYDALLDEYEKDETAEGIRKVFESLRDPLVELVGRIQSSGKKAPSEIMERTYPIPQQNQFGKAAAEAIGFDFTAGRLDISVHPFCTGLGAGDTRMTTRYNENDFVGAFFGVLHETGHAMYEQGLPKKERFGEPIAESVSLGIHESQSRMWENLVGRSKSFWKHMMPLARSTFGKTLDGVTDEQWYFAINDVQPTFIRTESDETTYNLHILLRFEMETALLSDQLGVDDVPGAWNEKMKKYLGITPKDDAQGCLQDVHWSAGLVGYFPTYTLGNLYSAQFFEQARKEVGDLDAMFAKGEFKPLLGWLRERIHRHGRKYSPRQLVKRITGNDLDAAPLLRHLRSKASELYGVR